ncbi:hypothetical protein GBF38_002607 [Nibea albiflora]|uniref:Uncharacterized protein n=1 Tax=Nibea albiflora TaxID=240163 RepID=A0ACB7EE38_NIBAL|nr:hypothetical protein GBF38_002607 [Nibea albiflora]
MLLLLAALNFAQTEVNVRYFVEGGNMVLEPSVPERITNILWKHNDFLLAEWVENEADLTYYNSFDGRTTLNITSGRLEITKMTKADVGLYSVQMNSRIYNESYDVKVIKEVPEPKVRLGQQDNKPSLICEGETEEAEPVTYTWTKNGQEQSYGETLEVPRSDLFYFQTFSCRMKNPVSEKESRPLIISVVKY